MMNVKAPTILTNLQRGNVKQESPMLLHQRTLHELAAQGELYDIDPYLVNSIDINNMTPLHWASGYGQSSTVELLIRLGADPNHKSNGGKTPLMFASGKGYFHVVKILLRAGANMDAVDDLGNSALMYASHQDHGLVIQELIKNGVNLGFKNTSGQTAYSLALMKHNRSAQASLEARLLSLMKDQCSDTKSSH